MSLRNSPYLPLYVQDFMTDEKLAECSAQTTGVYIRLMCLMHKGNPYGTFLLNQKYKQNESMCLNFACNLARHLPYSISEIESSLEELLRNGIVYIDGDRLCQKRMVRDGEISLKRSESGRLGGNPYLRKNICLTKTSSKTSSKTQANSENEIENEIENKNKAIDYEDIINYWNNNCKSYSSVTKITEKRKRNIRNLIKNCHTNIDEIKKAMDMLEEADSFWKGDNDRQWKATFDWFIEDTKGCFSRILEGQLNKNGISENLDKNKRGDWQS